MIPEILFLVEQIGPATPQIDNLGTPVPVLFETGALEAVEGVADALAAADDAFVLVVAEGALVADAGEGGGAHVAVAHGALAVALVAEAADGYAGLFAAHDEVAGGWSVDCGEVGEVVVVRTHGWWRDMAGYWGCKDSKLCGVIARCGRVWRCELFVAEGVAWSVVLLRAHC